MTALDTNEDWLALLRTIRMFPLDPLPRLIAADWLEERGDAELAEFIRLDCEPGGIGHEDAHRLWHRYIADRWAGDLYAAGLVTVSPAVWDSAYQDHSWRAIIRQGFVSEIRCPLAWWLGGECGNCGGTGLVDTDRYEQAAPCHECGGCFEPVADEFDRGYSPGSGRLNAHGPAVVTRHPVNVVRITDLEPQLYGVLDDAGRAVSVHGWTRLPARPGERFCLPDDVWERLEGATHRGFWRDYPTAAHAHAALSRALLDPLRLAAGLPALTVEVTA